MSTDGRDFTPAIEDFKRGGWVVALLGGAGMAARMLLTDKDSPWVVWLRRISAGAIVGVLAFFATHGSDLSNLNRSLICSIAGAAAPEVVEEIRRRFVREAGNAVLKKKVSSRKRRGK